MRRLFLHIAGAFVALATVYSQPRPELTRRVIFYGVPFDSAGQPVSDLTASDFDLRDEGHEGRVTIAPAPSPLLSARAGERSNQPTLATRSTLVVFDLLNEEVTARSYAQAALIRGLRSLPSAAGVSLSIFTTAGALLSLGSVSGSGRRRNHEERRPAPHRY